MNKLVVKTKDGKLIKEFDLQVDNNGEIEKTFEEHDINVNFNEGVTIKIGGNSITLISADN